MRKRPDEKIAQVIKSTVEVASLPSVARRVLEILKTDEAPEALSEFIATDLGLTAQVLRLANSEFFSRRTPIASVSHATTLLGVPTLRSILLSASVADVVNERCEGFDPLRSWRHSLAVAMASKRLARCFFEDAQDDLYVAGLLHDAGIAVMAQYVPDDYGQVLRTVRDSGRPLQDVEREVFGMTHADVGYTLVTRWHLPNVLGKCIRGHGAEYTSLGSRTTTKVDACTEQWRCVDIVRFANRWALHQGISAVDSRSQRDLPFPDPPVWFGIKKENWAELLNEVREEFEATSRAVCPELSEAKAC